MTTMPDEANNQNQPLNPDLAGYPTTEALVAGYRASGEEAKRLKAELEKRDQLLGQFLTNGGQNVRQDVPSRAPRPEDRLTDFGVPVDALEQMIDARVNRGVESVLKPLHTMANARQKIVSQHPDYVRHEQDVAQFINSDPQLAEGYAAMYAANPYGAMEYALLKFADSRRSTVNGAQQVPNGRVDAGIPTSRAGEGRREPGGDSAIQEAFERFQRTGSSRDAVAYSKARLGPLLREQFARVGQTL